MQTPPDPSDEALAQARRMFCAVLAPWASDLLRLRRSGLDRPGFRRCAGAALGPGRARPAAARESFVIPVDRGRRRAA